MRRLILGFLVVLVVAAGQVNGEVLYDAYENFGDQQGSNGVWHYIEYTGTGYQNLTYGAAPYWWGSSPSWLGTDGDLNWLPIISKGAAHFEYPTYTHVLFMHPGDNSSRRDVVLRWQAPADGTANMKLSVQRPSESRGGDGYDVYLEHNGSVLNSFTVGAQDDQPHVLELPVTVEANDWIDLRIYNRGNNAYDAALVDWKLSCVEPNATPPEVLCDTDLPILWPPNHKMVDVAIEIAAIDDVTNVLTLEAVFASSNEPDDGIADGDTPGDIDGQDGFVDLVDVTDAFTYFPDDGVFRGVIQLRAERAGNGIAREYSIDAFVSDDAGNVGSDTCKVVVPHDQGKKKKKGEKK